MIEGTRSGDTRVRDSSSGRGMPSAERKREAGRGKPASALARELPGALELRRVGADRNSRARADADATELQGDGEALGGKHREEERKREEKRQDADRVFFLFSSLKKKKWNGYERSEYEGKRRGGTATAVPPRSTAAR